MSTVVQPLSQSSHDRLGPGETERHFLTVPTEFTEPHHIALRLSSRQHWLPHKLRIFTPDTRIHYTTGPCDIRLTSPVFAGAREVTLPLIAEPKMSPATTLRLQRSPRPEATPGFQTT